MKTTLCICLLIIFVAPALISSEEGRSSNTPLVNNTTLVTGIGYPPIKAENAAQARLMARRAAILDAYRNSLSGIGSPPHNEQTYYSGLSGFVKGMTIEKEEYLEDGSVRILARIPSQRTMVSPKAEGSSLTGKEKITGPLPVPLDEWYTIIERSVKYE